MGMAARSLSLIVFLFLSSSLVSKSYSQSKDSELKSIEVSLFGKLMSPRSEDLDSVRLAIGEFVSELQVRQYLFKAAGIEGGFLVCLEPMHSDAYQNMLQGLQSIEVDKSETTYTIQQVEACEEL